MGVCQSVAQVQASKWNLEIEKNIEKERRRSSNIIKLLLLGPGESGKSTILKQMRILHNGFSEEEILQQKPVIYSNTVTGMESMLRAKELFNICFQDPGRQEDAQFVMDVVNFGEESEPISSELAGVLKRLWTDDGVQSVFKRRNEYQLHDSAEYFLNALDRISEDGYWPSQDDILHARMKTTGVVEIKFWLRKTKFIVIDVGGQRSERRKWIHCFQDVNAVIFIVSLSEYDQVLHEDATTNRMEESLRLFDSICNNEWLIETSMILFLNKKDLFEEKLRRVPINIFFSEYDGPQEYEPSAKFVEKKFLGLKQNPGEKSIYTHQTCATDTSQVRVVLEGIIHTIMEKNMSDAKLF